MTSTVAPVQYVNIRVEKKNQIAYVTIARPKVLNALSIATINELRQAFHDLKNDSEVRVVIVTGEGEKAFVAGADIQEFLDLTAVTGKEYSRRGQAVMELIENLGKPVIAAVNGFALGGGCELAMACAIRIATPNAKFGQPEVKLGITPGFCGTQRLTRLVGRGLAMQMLLTGDPISAEEAYRVGLVNEIVAPAELMARAEAIANKIIANAPIAVHFVLEAVNKGLEVSTQEGSFIEATLFGVVCSTEDRVEGTRAFVEKRPAQFKGK
jgi:enoyl-CoA hydratase